jgi:hypothetical protein
MAHYHYFLLLCDTAIKENDDTLPSPSSSQTQRRQNTLKTTKQKPKKMRELTFKLLFCPFTFGSHFYLFVSNAFS